MRNFKVDLVRDCRADDNKKPVIPKKYQIILPDTKGKAIASWPSPFQNRRAIKITASGTATTNKNFSGAHAICLVNREPLPGEVIEIIGAGKKSASGKLIPRPKDL